MNRSPLDYKNAAVVAEEAGKELLARLEWMTCQPKIILDLGCGLGETSLQLQKRYPKARVLSIDLSEAMIDYAQNHALTCLLADANKLPLANHSADLIFANFLFPWCSNIELILKECRRVLRPNGLILFSALGPDTLKEWQKVLHPLIIPACWDMHDLGDLLQTNFSDPVLDLDYYTVTYRDINKVYRELYHAEMITTTNCIASNDQALTLEGTWAVTWEVIFAHAFANTEIENSSTSDGTTSIPLSHLRKQLHKS